jgi:hypothetical protein
MEYLGNQLEHAASVRGSDDGSAAQVPVEAEHRDVRQTIVQKGPVHAAVVALKDADVGTDVDRAPLQRGAARGDVGEIAADVGPGCAVCGLEDVAGLAR